MSFDLNVALGLDMGEESASDGESSLPLDISSDGDDVFASVNPITSPIIISENVENAKSADVDPSEVSVDGEKTLFELSSELESKIEGGCSFGSLEQAYLFYCEYGRHKGFSVRKGDQRYVGKSKEKGDQGYVGKPKELRWKEYVCHCRGPPVSEPRVAEYRNQVKRSHCLAKIRVYPVSLGCWKITLFIKEHNHPLLSPDQTYLMRSSRNLSESRLAVVQSLNCAGVPVSMACGFMEVQCGGLQNVGYIRKDAYDKLRRLKMSKNVENGDSIALSDYFNTKSNSESFFFWRAKYDDERRLVHFFFRDSRSLSDYEAFGDILSIDTTHKTNRYNLSCAPFVGVNHHSSNVMFGVGFLSDETTETFEWLLGVFLESMKGKQPVVVFSDQCRALMNAIDSTFPSATHRLCQWHVNNNAIKHFGSLNSNEVFTRMWYRCMNKVETECEFECVWSEMMVAHVPPENTWLRDMYPLRRRWASVFSQSIFTAGLRATSRSEGTNRVLKAMIRSSNSPHDFVSAYEQIQSRWRDEERAEDAACLWLPGQFVSKNPLLIQAASVYTRNIYKKFEYQCAELHNVLIDLDDVRDLGRGILEFKATRTGCPNARPRTIHFDRISKSARCSCHMWEGEGIFCRHILRVYLLMNVLLIPEAFILKRWTKSAKQHLQAEHVSLMRSKGSNIKNWIDFQNLMMREEYDMVCSSKDSQLAQDYLRMMKDTTKQGLAALLAGKKIPSSAAVGSKGATTIPFANPRKVKEKGFANTRKKDDSPAKSRRGRSKCPGVSTRSRKRVKGDEVPSFSEDHIDISVNNPNSGFFPLHATQ